MNTQPTWYNGYGNVKLKGGGGGFENTVLFSV